MINAAPVIGSTPVIPVVPALAAPGAVRAEDDQQEDGASIDTFTEYQPTALPAEIIRLFNNIVAIHSESNKDFTSPAIIAKSGKENEAKTPLNDSIAVVSMEETHLQSASPTTSAEAGTTTGRLLIPSHTSSACESALLSSVSAPKLPLETAETLLPLLQKNCHESLPLSPLQLEGVLLAIQRHRRVHNPSGIPGSSATRAGFFLGDGAGIGKGRQISAIIRDSCCRGRTRHVWLSVSRELVQDAKRDLTDIGVHISIHDGTSFLGDKNAPGLGRKDKGCLFLTYNLLVSTSRLEQIIAWLAGTEHMKSLTQKLAAEQTFDGLIVFDEAHKAKNLLQNTKTAQLVLQLQRRLPNARVVYASATGVSDIAQLAYAERLGIWNTVDSSTSSMNDGTQFADFKSFQHALERRGLGSMELLALELKTRGCFIARTLSWEGAEFQTEQIALSREQQHVYNKCVHWFLKCKHDIEDAFRIMGDNVPGTYKTQIWRTYWAAHQRFFKELAVCAKVPFIAEDARMQIHENGCCVVIGLQSTGDAGMQSLLDDDPRVRKKSVMSEEDRFPYLVSTVSAGLARFVEQHFPVAPPKPDIPKLPGTNSSKVEVNEAYQLLEKEIERIKALPPPLVNPVLVAKQQELLEQIPKLGLPPNPLDDLIDRLGGIDQVAEMTGRPGRVVRVSKGVKGDYFVYSKRIRRDKSTSTVSSDDAADRINLMERRHFMDGTKSVAIISDAASTGVSLHAANGSGASHKRRVHYTIELPWSADKAVQQLGRSHRSGQQSAPIYKLVVTNLGGERRFAAAVSKRLASLGALTKGDRRAASGSDMSSFDLDSKYGKKALKRLYTKLQDNESSGLEEPQSSHFLPARHAGDVIDAFVTELKATKDSLLKHLPLDKKPVMQSSVLSIALEELEKVGLDRDARGKCDVRTFLNRLAGITVSRQSLVFSLFMSTLDDVIKEAKVSGEFEGTAEDITATSIEIGHEEDLAVDPSSGTPTKMTTLLLDRGISFQLASDMAAEEARKIENGDEDAAHKIEDTAKDSDHAQDISTNDSLDGFIVDDDESQDDEWMSTVQPKKQFGRAEAGFYISKYKIVGRYLILFAKGKFDYESFNSKEEASSFDPLGLMQVSRPNTGTNITDMPTKDLKRKYTLACSCQSLKAALEEGCAAEPADVVRAANKKVVQLWDAAFKESDNFESKNGLAPRRVKVALVNGPVLHILSALERVVVFRPSKDQTLKIMRAQVGHRRIVGVRFPTDDDSKKRLQEELERIRQARRHAGCFYKNDDLDPICCQSQQWATAKRKTITSFFKVSQPSTGFKISNSTTTKDGRASYPAPTKRGNSSTPSSSSKKSKTLMSFFGKKKEDSPKVDEIDLTLDD